MIRIVQILLAIQFCPFAFAASAHTGIFGSREDPAAAGFETLIAVVLAAALVTSFVRPWLALVAARAAQGFALILTLVGFTLVLTVGPTTTFDVTMHLMMLATLVVGLAFAAGRQTLHPTPDPFPTWVQGRTGSPEGVVMSGTPRLHVAVRAGVTG